MMMMSGAAVRQLVVFQSRPASRLRYTQLSVLARPLTRTCPGGEPSLVERALVIVRARERELRALLGERERERERERGRERESE
jgi:hypothetical protein